MSLGNPPLVSKALGSEWDKGLCTTVLNSTEGGQALPSCHLNTNEKEENESTSESFLEQV